MNAATALQGLSPSAPDSGVREIPLTKGYFALVDAEDFDWLSKWRWHAVLSSRGIVYAARGTKTNGRAVNLRMHRVVLEAPSELHVDHINGNTLDNRKSNLRFCTNRQNSHNRRSTCASGYKGVRAIGSRWRAVINLHGVQTYLGAFDTAVEAARAYDAAAIKHFGEFARPNFPAEVAEAD